MHFSFKTCYICEERGRESKTAHGACMNCNKTGCRHAFHVTWYVVLFLGLVFSFVLLFYPSASVPETQSKPRSMLHGHKLNFEALLVTANDLIIQ